MTREETKKRIEVMQAYINGEKIEYRNIATKSGWRSVGIPCWDWFNYEYRVKPEPKVRPYANAEEFLDAMKQHGPMIRGFEFDNLFLNVNSVHEKFIVTNIWHINYKALTSGYTWQDGTPCGVVEE